jgi:hypothetical protein
MYSFLLYERATNVASDLIELEHVFADYQNEKISKKEFKVQFNKVLKKFTKQKRNFN